MDTTFRVRINLEKIQSNLTAASDPVIIDEVTEWLVEAGFQPAQDGWWLCEVISFDTLDP